MKRKVSVYGYTGSPEDRYPLAETVISVPDEVGTNPIFYVDLTKIYSESLRETIETHPNDEDYDFLNLEDYSVVISPTATDTVDALQYDNLQIIDTLFEKLKENTN